MPYLDGQNMVFCVSAGVGEFSQQPNAFETLHKIPPRVTRFQRWTPAIRRGDGATDLIAMPWAMDTPNRVYCNPVLAGSMLSVVYNRALFIGETVDNKFSRWEQVISGIFTGYKLGTKTVIGKVACAGGSQVIVMGGAAPTSINTVMDYILRIVPYNTGNIITGMIKKNPLSVYLDGDSAQRLQVGGKDIYKCYLTADAQLVVHAVKGTDFEERTLHSDTVELVPYPDFISHKNS